MELQFAETQGLGLSVPGGRGIAFLQVCYVYGLQGGGDRQIVYRFRCFYTCGSGGGVRKSGGSVKNFAQFHETCYAYSNPSRNGKRCNGPVGRL